jgi:hypothetical protein
METRRDPSRLLWGVLLVALGLLFLAGNFGYRTWFVWDRWWPLLLIAIGVILLYRRRMEVGAAPVGPPVTVSPPPAPGADRPGLPAVGPAEPGAPPGAGPPSPAPEPGAPAGESRRFPTGAIILIGVGLAFLFDEMVGGNAFPAFVLIAIGVALLLRQRAAS